MSMGPFVTTFPGMPPAKSLENAYQFRKVFPDEIGPDGAILPIFYERLRAAHNNPVPERRKRQRSEQPVFALYTDASGQEIRLDYIQSREFYCAWYEGFVFGFYGNGDATRDFVTLLNEIFKGRNLLICGYDGQDWEAAPGATDAEKLDFLYQSPKRPFGHELVLATMLRYPYEPELWPWRRHVRHVEFPAFDTRSFLKEHGVHDGADDE